jgi:CubicO group peptidase (beta-lactamase class C family)
MVTRSIRSLFILLISASLLILPGTGWADQTDSGPDTSIEKRGRKALTQTSSEKLPPSSWDNPLPSSPVLHPGTPSSAGMDPEPLKSLDTYIEQAIQNRVMPGAVVLVARRGAIVKHQAYGYAARYADDQFTPLPDPVPMRKDTIFDLASITKIFTATAVMKLYEQGKIGLDDPVARYIPEFAQNGKENVTIRQLLTHTSGFRPGIPLYKMGTGREDRLQIVFAQPLDHAPGSTYVYSDLNMIVLGALVERISGKRLDEFIRDEITKPLGMKDTMFNPPAELKNRIAATEYQPWTGRGLVWGQVHDENAASLGGVAGHAGLFSSARDLAVFAHMILMKGRYGGVRILNEETVELMEHNYNTAFPGDDHGLGWELNQGWYMDALASPYAMGHTGYTGTSLVISRDQATIVITLTNRVHPTRQTVSTNPVRRQTARMAADAIPVAIPGRGTAWFSGYGDFLDRSLTAELPTGSKALKFETWYRIEDGIDRGAVEVSADGTVWDSLEPSYTGASAGWIPKTLPLPENARFVRFRYVTDLSVNGRGWYVKGPAVLLPSGKTVPLQPSGEGWELRRR